MQNSLGCILFFFYIKPQPFLLLRWRRRSCILFFFYIKPQHIARHVDFGEVVSYSFSTSNHNLQRHVCARNVLYLILFLHQTTTDTGADLLAGGCILFFFYIKPQPGFPRPLRRGGCILFFFYIKPQLYDNFTDLRRVVSYSFSTSNHNQTMWKVSTRTVYLILFLHQTTTHHDRGAELVVLYLILFLHQTTTTGGRPCARRRLYLILFLHQTTTYRGFY